MKGKSEILRVGERIRKLVLSVKGKVLRLAVRMGMKVVVMRMIGVMRKKMAAGSIKKRIRRKGIVCGDIIVEVKV